MLPLPQLDDVAVDGLQPFPPDLITHPPAFVQLGRSGDLLLLMPAWRAWAELTGAPIRVVSTRQFGTVLDGASYIKPTLLYIDWHAGIRDAIATAHTLSPYVVVTQLHATGWEAQSRQPDGLSSYALSMWKRTGYLEHYAKLPLVFDRRHAHREAVLIARHVRTKRPLLLVNLEGWTSPLGSRRKNPLLRLLESLQPEAEVLHLDRAHADRVYDQLGLMDIACGLLTCDTMPLHLAPASKVPYIALVRDEGQSGSIPKGNCVLTVGYSQLAWRMDEIERTLRTFIRRA